MIQDINDFLKEAEILNEVNCSRILKHPNHSMLYNAVAVLSDWDLLTQDHFNYIISHHLPFHLAMIFNFLQKETSYG